jgi:hypothetical protein
MPRRSLTTGVSERIKAEDLAIVYLKLFRLLRVLLGASADKFPHGIIYAFGKSLPQFPGFFALAFRTDSEDFDDGLFGIV